MYHFITKKKEVPFSSEQMFGLVNDVESYQDFFPYCVQSTVLSSEDDIINAKLVLKIGISSYSLYTTNIVKYPNEIQLQTSSESFIDANATWDFNTVTNNSCEITFTMKYKLKNILNSLLKNKIDSVFEKTIESFCSRAYILYGN